MRSLIFLIFFIFTEPGDVGMPTTLVGEYQVRERRCKLVFI